MKFAVGILAGDPRNSSVYYAGSSSGLLKSTDQGRNWIQSPFYPLGRIQPPVFSLAIDLDNSARIYVGTSREHGLFWRSADGGQTWQSSPPSLPAGSPGDAIENVEVGRNGTGIYAQVQSGASYRLFGSFDGGSSWTQTGTAPRRVAIHAANPTVMYYASGMSVYRSSNAGASWNLAGIVRTLDVGDLSGISGLDVSPTNPSHLVATMTGNYGYLNGIFVSLDGGQNWQRKYESNNVGVRFNRQSPGELIAGDCCGTMEAYRSRDGGSTWGKVRIGPVAGYVAFASLSLAYHPSDSNTIFAPTGSGVWRTTDGGTNWTRVGTYRPTLVSDPDQISASLLARGTAAISTTLTLRALEDPSLTLSGLALSTMQNDWIRVAQGSAANQAKLTMQGSAVEPGSYQETVRVTATGVLNPELQVPVRLDVRDSASVAHVLAGSLVGTGGYFSAVTFDPQGDLVVAGPYRILRIGPDGTRTVIAGNGNYGTPVEGGPAVNSPLSIISAVAYDSTGNLYFSDFLSGMIRKVDRAGMLTRVAGSETGAYAQNGSPARSKLGVLTAMVFDPSGILYFATTSQLWRLRSDNLLQIVAGGGSQTAEGAAGTQTRIDSIAGLAASPAGDILFSDSRQNRVRRLTRTGLVYTVAGTGGAGFSGDGAAASDASLDRPGALATDAAGNVYLADAGGLRVRRVLTDGTIESLAGVGFQGSGGNCTAALYAPLGDVHALAWRSDGTLAVHDSANRDIYALRPGLPVTGQTTPLPDGTLLNGASYTATVAPGSIFTMFGSAMAGSAAQAAGAWPASLAGTTVCLADRAAPLYYASPTQLNGQVPVEIGAGDHWLRVYTPSGISPASVFTVAPTAPGVFQYGDSRAVAVNANGRLNGPSEPASPDSWITVYVTGIGAVDNPVPTGQAGPSSPLSPARAASRVSVGGNPANVYFTGLAPGFVGLGQVNVQVPQLAPGDYPLIVEVGGVPSQTVQLRVE